MAIRRYVFPPNNEGTAYINCDCGAWTFVVIFSWYTDEEIRSWARIGGWTLRNGQDLCSDCSQKERTLASERTDLNRQLEEVRERIAAWPHWFRQHAGFCPPGCPDCAPDGAAEVKEQMPVRVYSLEEA